MKFPLGTSIGRTGNRTIQTGYTIKTLEKEPEAEKVPTGRARILGRVEIHHAKPPMKPVERQQFVPAKPRTMQAARRAEKPVAPSPVVEPPVVDERKKGRKGKEVPVVEIDKGGKKGILSVKRRRD